MNVALWLRQPGENFSELLRESDSYNRKDLVCFDSMLLLLFFREGVHWRTEKFLFSSCNIWFNFHGLENFFLLLSPHLNHFRPVEANANKFPDIYKSRNRIPSFFYQILSTPNSFWQWTNRDEDDRVATSLSVSDPWERCLDSGLKRKGGSCCCCYQAVSTNPSSTPLASYDPQHVQIRTLRSHFYKQRPDQVLIYLLVTLWGPVEQRPNDCFTCIVEIYVFIFVWWFSQKKERVCSRSGACCPLRVWEGERCSEKQMMIAPAPGHWTLSLA